MKSRPGRGLYHQPLRLPPPSSVNPSSPSPALAVHRVLVASHSPPLECHFRRPFSSLTALRAVSPRPRFTRSPSFYLGVYDRLQDHLRRHLLEQVAVHSWTGDDLAPRD
ncbi:hypothetical protein BOTBODRAFT_287870 [Botryobasidium botryosum FD-172 SS1]|uniref:Uncharacterized protein n=1 Tax=Botryobasidium botryosum (strain FD-172 SS1) TaxID=930990 RepID=A0A067LRP0_BOTB1|nr:hypothetical protein BOTBODRAFT_287870 [Botryobasidium botryosum FD-172 SS1]